MFEFSFFFLFFSYCNHLFIYCSPLIVSLSKGLFCDFSDAFDIIIRKERMFKKKEEMDLLTANEMTDNCEDDKDDVDELEINEDDYEKEKEEIVFASFFLLFLSLKNEYVKKRKEKKYLFQHLLNHFFILFLDILVVVAVNILISYQKKEFLYY